MAKKDKFKRFKRDIDSHTMEEIERFLIVCEGEKTEPLYFEFFEVFSANIKVIGAAKNTESLVNSAIDFKNKGEYDQVWCVFDKNSFNDQQFNNACSKAAQNGMHVAYSNQSFELWYILHFGLLESQLDRHQYINNLDVFFKKQFGKSYQKNDIETFQLLRPFQEIAIRNAKKLASYYNPSNTPSKRFPVTYVFELVEELNKFSRNNRWVSKDH